MRIIYHEPRFFRELGHFLVNTLMVTVVMVIFFAILSFIQKIFMFIF